jgi:hypothetical protein
MENLIALLDRSDRVLIGTRIRALEHVPERIPGEINRIRC